MLALAIMTVWNDSEQIYRMIVETDARTRKYWLAGTVRQTKWTFNTVRSVGFREVDGYSMN